MNDYPSASIRVVLRAVPVAMLVETYGYVDGLLRELGLIGLGQHQGVHRADRGAELLGSIDKVLEAYEHERANVRQQAEAAFERGTGWLDLSFEMPPEAVAGTRTLLGLLEEVWQLSASGAFLTLAPSQEACRFQRRLLTEILRQAEDGHGTGSSIPHEDPRSSIEQGDRVGPLPVALHGAHVHEALLSSGPEAPRQARRIVTRVLSACGAEALVDMAQLVVSELVTNTLLHASSSPYLRLWCTTERIRVEVCDDKAALPALQRTGPDSVTGRGLGLVDAVSDHWGAYLEPVGKCVWVDLHRNADPSATEEPWYWGLPQRMAAHPHP